jgi:hypothetical protein
MPTKKLLKEESKACSVNAAGRGETIHNPVV